MLRNSLVLPAVQFVLPRLPARRLHRLSEEIYESNILNFREVKAHLNSLHMNRFAHQSEISKLSSYYRGLSLQNLASSADLLNSAIYYSSIFSKKIPDSVLLAARDRIQQVDVSALRALAQKLLNLNQWPTAEKLICLKFGPAEAELLKFDIYSLNGNCKRMLECLPFLAKESSVPPRIQLQVQCLLCSKDGCEEFDSEPLTNVYTAEDASKFGSLLQNALKGRVLGMIPPSLNVFLRLTERISRQTSLDSRLIFLGFLKCKKSEFDSDLLDLLTLVYSRMTPKDLVHLARRVKSVPDNFPKEAVKKLLEAICKLPSSVQDDIVPTLLCWCIRFFPEQYSYEGLITDYSTILDLSIANVAFDVFGLNREKSVMKFIEFCIFEKKIPIPSETLRDAIDTSQEEYGYKPSEEFLRCIHSRGYTLSSKFYLSSLEESVLFSKNFRRAFESFKLISSSSLHGDLLKNYLSLSKKLLDNCLNEGRLDYSNRIYKAICKYELIETLQRPKSFFEFVSEKQALGSLSGSFRSTLNLECINVALHCAQNSKKTPSLELTDAFCKRALRSSLIQCDFHTAHKIRVYMNNQGYCDEELIIENVPRFLSLQDVKKSLMPFTNTKDTPEIFRLIDSGSKGSDQKFLVILSNLKSNEFPSDRKFFNTMKVKNADNTILDSVYEKIPIEEDNKTLFLSNFFTNTRLTEFSNMFAKYSFRSSLLVPPIQYSSNSKYLIVRFQSECDALMAYRELDGLLLKDAYNPKLMKRLKANLY